MCPYTLDHNKMLASTMQHSTHHHTPNPPQPPPHPHNNKRDALDGPGRERPPEKTTHQPAGVFSGPNSVPRLVFDWRHVPPSHTPNEQEGVELTRRKPTTTCRGLPPHTGRLLRKEVIQPHLPVRLPCYDFVPIASPTFDDSPPQTG